VGGRESLPLLLQWRKEKKKEVNEWEEKREDLFLSTGNEGGVRVSREGSGEEGRDCFPHSD